MKRLLLLVLPLVLMSSACSDTRDARIDSVLADTETASPLAELFGVSAGSASDSSEAEALVADCMARAGFDYEPVTESPGGISFVGAGAPSLDEIRDHGYGIADDLERGIREYNGEVFVDPNDEIKAGLSAAEVVQYEKALTGISSDEITFSDDGVPLSAATGEPASLDEFEQASSDGCAYQAYASLINESSSRLLGSDIYAEAQSLIQGDPEMVELTNDWRRCMNDSGYTVRDQADIFDDLVDEGDDVYHEATEDHHDVTAVDITAMIDGLRDREIAIATTDWECSQPLFTQTPQITRRIEAAFILDNEDRLVDLLDGDT